MTIDRLHKKLDAVAETVFAGRIDEWQLHTIDGRAGITGPGGSFGYVTDSGPDGATFEYHCPNPTSMGMHWHSYTETLIGVDGEMLVYAPIINGNDAFALTAGTTFAMPAFTPHRVVIPESAVVLVMFGPGVRFLMP